MRFISKETAKGIGVPLALVALTMGILLAWDYAVPNAGFVPRGQCGPWTVGMKSVYVGANFAIGLAYFCIPYGLWRVWVARRRDMPKQSWAWLGFAAFIILCGAGHLLEGIGAFWLPCYRLFAIWHAMTAVVSVVVAVRLIGLLPYFLTAPSPEQYESMVEDLSIANRKLKHDLRGIQQTKELLSEALALVDWNEKAATATPPALAIMQSMLRRIDNSLAATEEKLRQLDATRGTGRSQATRG